MKECSRIVGIVKDRGPLSVCLVAELVTDKLQEISRGLVLPRKFDAVSNGPITFFELGRIAGVDPDVRRPFPDAIRVINRESRFPFSSIRPCREMNCPSIHPTPPRPTRAAREAAFEHFSSISASFGKGRWSKGWALLESLLQIRKCNVSIDALQAD